jgi:single-strand DNA-binding protein
MNRVDLIGRIATDLDVRKNEAGNTKCNFRLAVPRIGAKEGLQQTDFFTVVVWNKQAENLEKYQGKGCLIAVEGELRKDQYKDGEDTKYYDYVLAQKIDYLSGSGTKEVEEVEESTGSVYTEDIELTDEDLPF